MTPFQSIPLGVRFRQFADPTAIEYTPDGNAVQPPPMGLFMARTNPRLLARGWAYYMRNAMSLRPISLNSQQVRTLISMMTTYNDQYPECVGISTTKQEVVPGSGIPKRVFIYGDHPDMPNGANKRYAMMITFEGTNALEAFNITATVRGVTENPIWTQIGVPTPSRIMGLNLMGGM